ncbi:uncharacterized protein LY89DRAFT_680927 [Mollisia scopiformis]|uniref:Uncharacterized protein n=1 Tax=Mollisia scopiformis TaxID=149040 RepID=A0A194XRL8_MOLSC|nr:uncharacterized protein LY89DRAFT_680927 [Mollisia scopiformis]KUJ22838.1 hypothetical protein LY89DRAFT_680927 [Mollisia scopiformis]
MLSASNTYFGFPVQIISFPLLCTLKGVCVVVLSRVRLCIPQPRRRTPAEILKMTGYYVFVFGLRKL